MSDIAAYYAEQDREFRAAIERNAGLMRWAEENGYPAKTSQPEHTEGTWWEVPAELVGKVGCMMARVA